MSQTVNNHAALAQQLGITPLLFQAVRTQIAPPGCPDDAIALYFYRCKALGADPLGRLLYIAHRRERKGKNDWEDRWPIETTIDGFRAIGESTGQYDGQDAPVYEYDADGNVYSATVTIYRKDITHNISATAFFSEYCQTKDGIPTFMWLKMPRNQLAKCAEALAWRKAFPKQLNGIYIDTEMEQGNSDFTPIAATPAQPANKEKSPREAPKAKPISKPQLTLIRKRTNTWGEDKDGAFEALMKEDDVRTAVRAASDGTTENLLELSITQATRFIDDFILREQSNAA